MGIVMRCVGASDVHDAEGNLPPIGYFLKTYEPEAYDGRGLSDFTRKLDEAMVFPDVMTAVACWRQVPANRPLRADGRPNRPLTAMSMEFLDVEVVRAETK